MTNTNRSLLSAEEQAICEQISKNDNGLYYQRARVLLALNKGMSQKEAGELSGLTVGQVGHCLERFRQLRTASIFSTETQTQSTDSEPRLSSQLINTESKIADTINKLKQNQDRMNSNKTAPGTNEKIKVPADSEQIRKADKKKNKKPKKKRKKGKKKKNKKKKRKK